jgi:hypothetical protein
MHTIKPIYLRYPPAWFHSRILVGPGAFLTPEFVRSNNITHVINCAMQEDSPAWFRQKYPDNYVCLEALDSEYHCILDWYPHFESLAHTYLRDGSGTVYVHCQAGMNRSGFLALTYVCKNFSMPFKEVVTLFQRQRPCLFQNLVYMNQVKDFINGCVPSSQDTRDECINDNIGDSGFGT